MILQCEYKKEYKFIIDTENKSITWDNRTGHLEKLIADHGEYIEIMLSGVSEYYESGNSYITPSIFKEDITACNDWETLETIFNNN
jgi:hypothetical protein